MGESLLLTVEFTPWKTNMATETPPFQDVFATKTGDVQLPSFPESKASNFFWEEYIERGINEMLFKKV